MGAKLLLYMALLGVGLLLGRKGIFGEKVYNSLEKLQMICLLILLFTMGISLGANQEIIDSLGTIGFNGILFGLTTVFFSVGFVHLYSRFVLNKTSDMDAARISIENLEVEDND